MPKHLQFFCSFGMVSLVWVLLLQPVAIRGDNTLNILWNCCCKSVCSTVLCTGCGSPCNKVQPGAAVGLGRWACHAQNSTKNCWKKASVTWLSLWHLAGEKTPQLLYHHCSPLTSEYKIRTWNPYNDRICNTHTFAIVATPLFVNFKIEKNVDSELDFTLFSGTSSSLLVEILWHSTLLSRTCIHSLHWGHCSWACCCSQFWQWEKCRTTSTTMRRM